MSIENELLLLAENPNASICLEELVLGLAQDEYPNLDIEAYKSEIAAFSHGLKLPKGTDLELRVRSLCLYLTHELGLDGNNSDYYNPDNSYLNKVIDTRRGIPISLSILAMCIGRKSGLRLFGVGLPGHFIAKACEGNNSVYFDIFNQGKILSQSDCEQLAFKTTGEQISLSEHHFAPMANGAVIIRMLTNLKFIYLKNGDKNRTIRTLQRLRQIAPNDTTQMRDLGMVLLEAGQPGKAIDNLESYLRKTIDPFDYNDVNLLIKKANKDISSTN